MLRMRPDGDGSGQGAGGGAAGQAGQGQDGQGQQGAAQGQGQQQGQGQAGQSFDFVAWMAAQPAEVRAGFDQHEAGLRNALASERTAAQAAADQLREAKKGQSAEVQAQLEALAQERDSAVRRAEFMAAAQQSGCRNIDAAWHIAAGLEAFDKAGKPQLEAVKAAAPELWAGPQGASTHAGQGTGAQPPQAQTVDDAIRQAAGRRRL